MLPRSSRLSSRRDVAMTMRLGKRIYTRFSTVYIRSSGRRRAACVVGKRVYKAATDRHRLQRQLREVVRELLSQLPTAHDIVIVARPDAAHAKNINELREIIIPAVLRVVGSHKE